MRKKLLLIVFCFCLFWGLAACSFPWQNNAEEDILVFASGPLSSQGYRAVEAFSAIYNENGQTAKKIAHLSTVGSSENILLLRKGQVDLAQVNSYDYFRYYHSLNEKEKGENSLPICFTYAQWPMGVVVQNSSSLTEFAQLKGKSIYVGEENSSTVELLKKVIEAYGWEEYDVQMITGSWDIAEKGFRDGSIEALCINHLGGTSLPTVYRELAQDYPFRPVTIEEPVLQKLAAENDDIRISTIHKGISKAYWVDMPAPGFVGFVIASPNLEAKTVEQFLQVLNGQEESLQNMIPQMSFSLPNKEDDMIANNLYHNGAILFYRSEKEGIK